MSQLMKNMFALMTTQQLDAEAKAVAAAKDAVRAAEQRLTYDEFENLWDAIMDISNASDLDAFTFGFRMGMQLTLEGLRPIN